jgi:hypothetical protein
MLQKLLQWSSCVQLSALHVHSRNLLLCLLQLAFTCLLLLLQLSSLLLQPEFMLLQSLALALLFLMHTLQALLLLTQPAALLGFGSLLLFDQLAL